MSAEDHREDEALLSDGSQLRSPQLVGPLRAASGRDLEDGTSFAGMPFEPPIEQTALNE
jgi:hypothetical protein